MAASEVLPVNHHADHPGFSGLTGAIVGLMLLWMGRANARLAADITGVSSSDRVVDVGCGPGGAVREAARRGARVTGVDPAPVMLRLARTFTRDDGIEWAQGTAENVPLPDGSATVAVVIGDRAPLEGRRPWARSRRTGSLRRKGDCSPSSAGHNPGRPDSRAMGGRSSRRNLLRPNAAQPVSTMWPSVSTAGPPCGMDGECHPILNGWRRRRGGTPV